MRICILGSGKVGSRLGKALYDAGHTITCIYNRSVDKARVLAADVQTVASDSLSALPWDSEVFLIAIKDDAIIDVYHSIKDKVSNALILHTAGSVPLDVFEGYSRCGVLWPVQTISENSVCPVSEWPFVISGSNKETLDDIFTLVNGISHHVYPMDDSRRLVVHLGATIANNFSNHMYTLAERLLTKHEISFDILRPIIQETAAKIHLMSPEDAQTGAAIRGDIGTMERHISIIADDPGLIELYWRISADIAGDKKD